MQKATYDWILCHAAENGLYKIQQQFGIELLLIIRVVREHDLPY